MATFTAIRNKKQTAGAMLGVLTYVGSAPQRQQNKQQKHKAKQSESGPQG